MTRDEIRRAFRQAQQEQFAAVPQQPKIDVSPKFQRKMERLLQRAPRRRISKKQRIVGILLAAVLLVLGGCTVYQIAFTNGAYIKYTGAYTNYDTNQLEYHYLIAGYRGEQSYVPHYQFPDPQGFIHLYDGSYEPSIQTSHYDQWYNADTSEVLNLTQELMYPALRLEVPIQLESTDLDGVTVYYGCGEEKAYAFWLYENSAIKLEYWGSVSEEQLLSWIQQMDYTSHSVEMDFDRDFDFCCYMNYDYSWDVYPPIPLELKYWYRLWDEVYDNIDQSATGRATSRGEEANYHFETLPEGFTLTADKAKISSDDADSGGFCLGWSNDYTNSTGDRIRLQQVILSYLPNGNGHYTFAIPSTHPMEEIKVLDMDGLYGKEEGYSRLVWRYGGRMMEILYYGDISQQEIIALAETVDYSQE